MIKTASDFENAISYITNDINDDITKNIIMQGEYMDSSDFNSTMNYVVTELNKLYEKTRVLNDIYDYAKEYIQTTVYNKKQECEAILKSVEANRDRLKTNDYIYFDVNFESSAGSYTDRDGTKLPTTDLNNGNIVLSGDTISTISPKDYVLEKNSSSIIPYQNNINDFIKGNVYRSYYLLDKPATNGIIESIKCELNSRTEINAIKVLTSNCNITSYNFVTIDNVITDVNVESNTKKSMCVTDVVINICCNNYKLVSIQGPVVGIVTPSGTPSTLDSGITVKTSNDIDSYLKGVIS